MWFQTLEFLVCYTESKYFLSAVKREGGTYSVRLFLVPPARSTDSRKKCLTTMYETENPQTSGTTYSNFTDIVRPEGGRVKCCRFGTLTGVHLGAHIIRSRRLPNFGSMKTSGVGAEKRKVLLTLLGLQSRFGDNWGQTPWNLSALSPKPDGGRRASIVYVVGPFGNISFILWGVQHLESKLGAKLSNTYPNGDVYRPSRPTPNTTLPYTCHRLVRVVCPTVFTGTLGLLLRILPPDNSGVCVAARI